MPVKIDKPIEAKEETVTPKKTPVKKAPAKTFADLYEILSAPIPEEFLITYTDDGKEFTGYHAQYAIDLLNKTCGLENVDIRSTILKQEMVGKSWFVAMEMEITITYKGKKTTRTGNGAAYAKSGANAYKGARTNAFKNACRFYGIGRELFVQGFDEDIIVSQPTSETVKEDTGPKETPAETPVAEKASEATENAESLINKIAEAETKSDLESMRATVSNFEAGDAVKKLLLKKFNEKLLSFEV